MEEANKTMQLNSYESTTKMLSEVKNADTVYSLDFRQPKNHIILTK